MALTSWKDFPFFNVSQVPVPADEDGSYVFDVRSDSNTADGTVTDFNGERRRFSDVRIRFIISRYFRRLCSHSLARFQGYQIISSFRLS